MSKKYWTEIVIFKNKDITCFYHAMDDLITLSDDILYIYYRPEYSHVVKC